MQIAVHLVTLLQMYWILVFLLVKAAASQDCKEYSGPCRLPNHDCPIVTDVCIFSATGEPQCCPAESLITPSTTLGPCVDKLNPKTGTSDCPQVAYLCNDPLYYDVMKDQCPKTCSLCSSSSGTSTTCRDLTNPATGTTDCPEKKYLCQAPGYVAFMKVQCPKTCGYCQ